MAGIPSLSSLRGGVNPVLSRELAGLINDPARFLSPRIVPARDGVAAGARESGTIITSSGLFGDGSTPLKRAVGASNNKNPGESLSAVTYTSEEYNLSDDIDERKIDGALIDYLQFTVEDIASRLSIQREVDLNDLLCTAANWTTNSFSAGTAWTDPSADPFNDMDTLLSSIGKYGRDANTIYLSKAALDAVRRNAGVKQYFPTDSNRNAISKPKVLEFIASEFGIAPERVFVQETSRNSANAGQAKSVDYLNGSTRYFWAGHVDLNDGVVAGDRGLTVRPSAVCRVMTKDPEFRQEEQSKPFPGMFVLGYWREALFQVNEQLGGLITA